MQLDIIKFYQDHNVPYAVEGHKHCRPGWVQTPCPFCSGNPGYHLGYAVSTGRFHCWRCGGHPVVFALAKLTSMSVGAIKKELVRYKSRRELQPILARKADQKQFQFPNNVEWRGGYGMHERYLEQRGYDPQQLVRDWDIRYTGPMASLDFIDYKFRVIIPITLRGVPVSFQGRDITGKHKLRYMACPKHREVVHHKHTLYGLDQCAGRRYTIGVEGIFDAWRLGPGAVATFGIEYTKEQVCCFVDNFDKVFIVFDDDPQAVRQARKLQNTLEQFEVQTEVLTGMAGDPDSFSERDLADLHQHVNGGYNEQSHKE